MPSATPRQMRDKAVFALLCLTGVRVAAQTSLKIKHVDLNEKSVTQNPREVATKFGKHICTFFAKGFEDAKDALAAWVTYRDEGASKALMIHSFPPPRSGLNQTQTSLIEVTGKSAATINGA